MNFKYTGELLEIVMIDRFWTNVLFRIVFSFSPISPHFKRFHWGYFEVAISVTEWICKKTQKNWFDLKGWEIWSTCERQINNFRWFVWWGYHKWSAGACELCKTFRWTFLCAQRCWKALYSRQSWYWIP